MSEFKYPVAYLEISDFSPDAKIVNPQLTQHPLFVMMQAGFCGFCVQAKPAFQQLAESNIIKCATIQPDGERPSEKALQSMVSKIYPKQFQGYPSYVLILPNGTSIAHEGGREYEDLQRFVSQYI